MKLFKIFSFIFIGLIVLSASFFLAGSLGINFGPIGTYSAYIVLSGSMEPSVPLGSVAIVQKANNYLSNDIISFTPNGDKKNIVTHRIMFKTFPDGIKKDPLFLTSGDKNNDLDPWQVKNKDIIGKVVFSVPYLGYIADFAKQPRGFIFLVIVPATIIIYEELKSIKKELLEKYRKWRAKKNQKGNSSQLNGINKAAIVIPLIAAAFALTSVTSSYFTDSEKTTSNVLSAASSYASPTPSSEEPTPTPTLLPESTPTPTPSTEPTISAGDVVINELMWMGSIRPNLTFSTSDEWIELRNMTSSPINISGWKLEEAGQAPNETIILSGIIPASSFFLISNYATNHPNAEINNNIVADQVINLSLDNGGEQLVLKDSTNNVIDSTPTGIWPEGESTSSVKRSMERNDPPGDGSLAANWHTCTDAACNDTTFWDTEGNNYGSPKAQNY